MHYVLIFSCISKEDTVHHLIYNPISPPSPQNIFREDPSRLEKMLPSYATLVSMLAQLEALVAQTLCRARCRSQRSVTNPAGTAEKGPAVGTADGLPGKGDVTPICACALPLMERLSPLLFVLWGARARARAFPLNKLMSKIR